MNVNEIVDAAIAVNVANRNKFRDVSSGMTRIQYAREFGTVAINLGRGAGKTRYIKTHARPWDVIIAPTVRMLESLDGRDAACATFVAEDFSFPGHRFRGMRPRQLAARTIYIDNASSIDRRTLDSIYETLAFYPEQTFVLLG